MNDAIQEYDSTTREWVTPEAEAPVKPEAAAVVEAPVEEPVKEPVVEAPVKKPRSDPQARIDQAIGKQREAERRAAALEAELAAARAAKQEAKPVPAANDDDPPPDPKKFTGEEYDPQYMRQMARWEARQEFREQQAKQAQIAAATQLEGAEREIEQKFGERYGAILAEDPEFPTKVDQRLLTITRLGALPADQRAHATFGNFIVEQVFQSEHPKELLLHLSDDAVIQRLATLPPIQVIRQLATFEASLGAASPAGPALKPPAISHAKRPITPVGSSPMVSNDEPGEDATDDEWLRYENAKVLKARRAGRG